MSDSYYGQPILNAPVWKADIPAYLFLGGLAGASSALAAGAQATRRPALARGAKAGALGAIALSLGALIHDLGRPSRFLNMLRVFKPTSPMSVGTWILTAYAPAAGIAAASDVSGLLPGLGSAATGGAALLGPAVAAYTSALLANTAVPAWHDGHRELPFVFAGSAATAAAGWGLLVAPPREAAPARRLAALGAIAELTASQALERRVGVVAEAYRTGAPGRLMRLSRALTTAGTLGALSAGRRSRAAAATSGVALLAASACTRFAIFHAGVASARDPSFTTVPQRARSAWEETRPGTLEAQRRGGTTMDDGTADTAKGRVKQAAGDLTGDRDIKREGKVDEAAGKAKEKVGEAADKVKDALRHDDDD